jgi:hypothetical protein
VSSGSVDGQSAIQAITSAFGGKPGAFIGVLARGFALHPIDSQPDPSTERIPS